MDAIPKEHPLSPQQWPVPPYPGEGREPDFSLEKISMGVGAKREHSGLVLGSECKIKGAQV